MNSYRFAVVAVLATVALVLCSHCGQHETVDSGPNPVAITKSELRIKILGMSKQEVLSALGKPTNVIDGSGGSQLYSYYSVEGGPVPAFAIRDEVTGQAPRDVTVEFSSDGTAATVRFS